MTIYMYGQLNANSMFVLSTSMSFIVFSNILNEPHWWCNGKRARLQCGRSWV